MSWVRLKRFFSVFHARNLEFMRDRGTMAWNFLFPVLTVGVFSFAFSGKSQDLFKVAWVGAPTHPAALRLHETQHVQFVDVPAQELAGALARVRRHQVDLVLSQSESGGVLQYWVNDSNPKGYLLERLLLAVESTSSVQRQTVSGREIRYVDWLISGLLGMNMMFSALFGVGYVIVRYRKNGVLRRFKVTPLGAFEFLSAQVVSRLWLILITSTMVFAGTNAVIHFHMEGSYFDLFLVLLLGSLCMISLGMVVASRIKSEELASGILNLLTWPMMFLSGVWFSLDGAPRWLQSLAQLFPLTHVIESARAIMTEGATLAQVGPNLGVLFGLSVVFMAVGTAIFRWE